VLFDGIPLEEVTVSQTINAPASVLLAMYLVVAEKQGAEAVGRVIVGRGQCLSFPGDPSSLPELLRAALPAEIPPSPRGAGQALLDSLP
jgi:methylmalonyl-CoA mutase N-terminal domain/subunit